MKQLGVILADVLSQLEVDMRAAALEAAAERVGPINAGEEQRIGPMQVRAPAMRMEKAGTTNAPASVGGHTVHHEPSPAQRSRPVLTLVVSVRGMRSEAPARSPTVSLRSPLTLVWNADHSRLREIATPIT